MDERDQKRKAALDQDEVQVKVVVDILPVKHPRLDAGATVASSTVDSTCSTVAVSFCQECVYLMDVSFDVCFDGV
jgi:hypothetical protein